MDQHIRFCTTSDGVRIAYATVGQGPPLVRVLGWFTHLEVEWENPIWRSFIDGLSRRHFLIRYDGRGMGLSDRDVKDFSPETHVRDLEAVVDAVGSEKVALFGLSQGGPTAIAYTLRHPDRVSHLILYGGGPPILRIFVDASPTGVGQGCARVPAAVHEPVHAGRG